MNAKQTIAWKDTKTYAPPHWICFNRLSLLFFCLLYEQNKNIRKLLPCYPQKHALRQQKISWNKWMNKFIHNLWGPSKWQLENKPISLKTDLIFMEQRFIAFCSGYLEKVPKRKKCSVSRNPVFFKPFRRRKSKSFINAWINFYRKSILGDRQRVALFSVSMFSSFGRRALSVSRNEWS